MKLFDGFVGRLYTVVWRSASQIPVVAMSQENSRVATTILVLVFLLHAALSAGFKMYYFSSELSPAVAGSSNAGSSSVVDSKNITYVH